ncbi:MAG: bifunctional folylpolyglutamate synthase/dihydrofolate synthase [Bacteroidota bacterium]
MNYRETLDYLYSRLPVFQRIGAAAYKADLHNTIALCKAAGNPEQKIKTIHVAGTNGKGSVSHFLAAIFQSAGYKTGLYTSPHLKDFRERIKVNGKMISKKYVVDFVAAQKNNFEKINPSFFEATVAMAFSYFRDQKTDIAVIETGLGGRLDSTNVIVPEISVITNISFDHMNLLGNTLEKIAFEKAGIIKPGIPVVIGEHIPETKKVFGEVAKKNKSAITYAQNKPKRKKHKSQLTGIYQQKNINTVLHAVEQLQKKGWKLSEKNIRIGIEKVVTLTGLHGRWQQLKRSPKVFCDIAHNEAGIKELLKQIKKTKHKNLHVVFGVVNDKEVDKVLSLLPKKANYYFTKANIPRALDEKLLQKKALEHKLKGKTFPKVKQAMNSAISNAGKQDLVIITGSAFVVAEVV